MSVEFPQDTIRCLRGGEGESVLQPSALPLSSDERFGQTFRILLHLGDRLPVHRPLDLEDRTDRLKADKDRTRFGFAKSGSWDPIIQDDVALRAHLPIRRNDLPGDHPEIREDSRQEVTHDCLCLPAQDVAMGEQRADQLVPRK